MYDKELTLEVLSQLHSATETLIKRFDSINEITDYTNSPDGMEKLDAACMLLSAIGESVKKLDKITNTTLLSKYPQIEWKKVMGLRDIIAHQYFDINAEAIYNVCSSKIKPLNETIKNIITDLSDF